MMNQNEFQFSLLGGSLHEPEMEPVEKDYQIMLTRVLSTILDRYERNTDYHFIDTKLSLITGRDFDRDDPIRGKNRIYPWIQGRGLEALAGHINWLQGNPGIDEQEACKLIARSRKMLVAVFSRMEAIRELNGGRLYFMMTPQGQALRVDGDGHVVPHELRPDSPSSFSDLFYVKGMAAAAHLLGMEGKLAESREWFKRICKDIAGGNFVSDQQQLDPKNTAVKKVEGRHSQGVYMISIGAVALLIKCGGDAELKRIGFEFIDHILGSHINLDKDSSMSKKYDMWEFVAGDRTPFKDEDHTLLSDPGHACEFVGLSLGMIAAMETYYSLDDAEKEKIAGYKQVLPKILKQNFANGFSSTASGIIKAFDLISREEINSDMPWWSLPETMRAAALTCRVVPAEETLPFEKIAAECSNAFVKYYIKSDLDLMAVQTVDKNGEPVDVIPATPDADPGYHTGLSIIDFLNK